MLENYNEFPDYMPVEELQKHFNNLMDTTEGSNNINYDGVIDGLWELADRQWHTYSLLDHLTKARVEAFISKILLSDLWKCKKINFLRRILSIVGNLGLTNSYTLIKEIRAQEVLPVYKQEVLSFIDEIDKFSKGKVDDPYVSFKKG
ncbi:MAG: hypothetical protein P4L50_20120 [Anaerolineaceae bacterium]|nr:hypothetical protein [Anaerolineaceae bacterium]